MRACEVASVVSDSLRPHGLYSPPGLSIHGILPARILEWVAMPSSRGSSPLRDWTRVSYISCTGRQALYYYLGSPLRADFHLFTVVFKFSPTLKLSGRLVKTQIPGVPDSRGWGGQPEKRHFWLVSRWCWFCWSRDHTLRTTDLNIWGQDVILWLEVSFSQTASLGWNQGPGGSINSN